MPKWNKNLGTRKVEVVSGTIAAHVEPTTINIYPVIVRWPHYRKLRERCRNWAELANSLDVLLPVIVRWNDIGTGCEEVCDRWAEFQIVLEGSLGDTAAITHYEGPDKQTIGLRNPERLAALERITRRIRRKMIVVQPARPQCGRKTVVVRAR